MEPTRKPMDWIGVEPWSSQEVEAGIVSQALAISELCDLWQAMEIFVLLFLLGKVC